MAHPLLNSLSGGNQTQSMKPWPTALSMMAQRKSCMSFAVDLDRVCPSHEVVAVRSVSSVTIVEFVACLMIMNTDS